MAFFTLALGMSCGSGTNRGKKRGKRADNCENIVSKQNSIILKGFHDFSWGADATSVCVPSNEGGVFYCVFREVLSLSIPRSWRKASFDLYSS